MDVAATPAISIIIPVLNEAAAIRETLTQLQPLRERGHEVIVVDGGSEDGTRDLASPLADRLLHAPRGRARQQQAGAEASRGNILWFVHADTQVPEDCDRHIIDALRGEGWGRFDIYFPGGGLRMRLVAGAMNLRSRITGIATGDQGIFTSRALFGRVNGYPDIPLMEDIALCRALRRETRPVCLRTRLGTSPRRWQTGGYLRTVLLMWALRLGYFIGIPPARLAKYYANGPR